MGKQKRQKGNTSSFSAVINALQKAVKELNSEPAKLNLYADGILAFIVVSYIIINTAADKIAIVIGSILNHDLTQYANDNTLLYLMIMLVVFAAACVWFCTVIRKNVQRNDENSKSNMG